MRSHTLHGLPNGVPWYNNETTKRTPATTLLEMQMESALMKAQATLLQDIPINTVAS